MHIDLAEIPILVISRTWDHYTVKLPENEGDLRTTTIKSPVFDFKAQGCATGHLLAMGVAQLGDGPVLVLEEDAEPTEDLRRTIEVPNDADMVHLNTSCHPRDAQVWWPVSDELVRHRNMLSNHAMMWITQRAKEAFAEANSYAISGHMNSDVARIHMQIERRLNVYGVRRPWFVQKGFLRKDTSFVFEDRQE